MSFTIFWNKKNAFLGQKKQKVEKVNKIDIFPEGLTHGFGPKSGIFQTFFFLSKIGQENVFYDILEKKKRLSRL